MFPKKVKGAYSQFLTSFSLNLNYLREHLKPTARIHHVILDGGKAPNVVPDYARAWYYVRDIDRESVEKNYQRVLKIIEGASKMTGTTYKIRFISGVHEFIINLRGVQVQHRDRSPYKA